MPSDFKRYLAELELGDHLYLLHGDEDERADGLAPVMREAFGRGHRCLYFADREGVEDVLDALRAGGVDVDARRAEGSLEVTGFDGRELVEGALDPGTLVDRILATADRAEADGHPGLWWIVEIPWHLRPGVSGEHIRAFEARLFDELPGSRLVALCQFDRRKLSDELLSTVLEAHPIAVLGDRVYPNPFYVPPRAVLDQYDLGRADWMLRQLEEARAREERLATSQRRLGTILDRAPALIARFDPELRCLYANPKLEEYTGLPPEERIGKTAEEAGLDPSAVAPWNEGIRRAFETGEEQVVVGPYRTPKGERWLRSRMVPEPSREGGPGTVLVLAQDVTEEREARREAEDAARLLRKTVASLDEAVFVVRAPGREILYCNPAAEEMFGYARDELVGGSTRELHVDEESFRRFGDESEAALASGEPYQAHFRMRRKDGTTFPSEHTVTLLNPDEGLEEGAVSVVRDVTEQRRAREALELSAERLEMLRELDRAILGARSEEEVLEAATGRIRELLGSWRTSVVLRAREPEGSHLVASCTEDESTRIHQTRFDTGESELLRELEDAGGSRVEDAAADPEALIPGARELVDRGLRSCFAVPLPVEDRIVGSLNVGYDRPLAFTEMTVELAREMASHLGLALRQARLLEEVDEATARRAAAEERAERLGGRLESLLDALELGVGRIAPEGTILNVNEAYARILGYASPDELEGTDVRSLMVHPERWSEVVDRIGAGSRLPPEAEYQLYRADGSRVWVAGWGRPIETPHGQAAFEGVIRDITDRKRLEERVVRIGIEERKRIGRELHDQLGQQLTGIAFLARSLADRSDAADGPAAEIASEARDAVARIRHLTRGLDPAALDDQGLADALHELAGEGRRLFGVEVVTDLDPETTVGEDEALHLYRIAQEALTNAVRHGGASRVLIELRTRDDERILQMRDDGSGMATESPDQEGFGLRSMRYRCEVIGGELEIRSEEGSGTTIVCHLPSEPAPPSTRPGIR